MYPAPALRMNAAPCSCRRAQPSAAGSRFVRSPFDSRDQIPNRPCGIFDASRHCWRAAHGAVELDEVVIRIMQTDRSAKVFKLFREGVCEATQPATVHPQGVILFLDVARRD